MRNIKIGRKLLIGFGLLLLFIAVAVSVSYSYIKKVQHENEMLATEIVPTMTLNIELERTIYAMFSAIDTYRLTEADTARSVVEDYFAKVDGILRGAKSELEANPSKTGLQPIVTEVYPAFTALRDMVQGKMKVITAKKNALGAATITGDSLQDILKNDIIAYHYDLEAKAQAETPGVASARNTLIRKYENFLFDIADMRRHLFVAFFHQDIDEVKGILKLSNALRAKLDTLPGGAGVDTPARAGVYDRARETANLYMDQIEEQVNLFVRVQELHGATAPLKNDLNATATRVTVDAQKNTQQIAEGAARALRVSMNILLYSTLAAGILGIGIALFISRIITRPLSNIVNLAARAEAGDLTIRREEFGYEGRDELGTLAGALSNMILQQERTLNQVISVADEVARGTENLTAVIEQANSSTNEIKKSIDAVVKLSEDNAEMLQRCNQSVDEMSVGADTTAQSASTSAEFISQITEASNNAVATVNSTIHEMDIINGKSQESESKIGTLVTAIEQISQFVSVITNMADQTNLLALNAAIEAARAGDAGRGFAVVAEEVRKLAEQSGAAANNIDTLIGTLQQNARDVITVTNESGEIISGTKGQADRAQSELSNAVNSLQNANESIQNIAAVAQEQSAASKEIAQAIDGATTSTVSVVKNLANIRQATEESAHASDTTVFEAQAMLEQVTALREILKQFKINGKSRQAALSTLTG